VPASRLARLRRGVNLSHWFSQSRDYSEKHLREHTTRRDIELIKSLGFDHVRFPVEPAPFFNEANPSELDAEYVRRLDAALDMLLASGLAVVLDLHPSDEFKIKLRTDDRAVNALALGMVATDMASGLDESYQAKIIEQIPLGRFAEADEVGQRPGGRVDRDQRDAEGGDAEQDERPQQNRKDCFENFVEVIDALEVVAIRRDDCADDQIEP
jgi:hypothetical protein